MNTEIFSKVDQYISNLLAPEDEILLHTIKSLDDNGLPQHSVSANQGKFFFFLMRACNAKRVLELGTLAGYSTIWLARGLPKEGILVTIESDAVHAQVAKKNIEIAGLSNQVEIKVGKALEILPIMIKENPEPFDFIFIDADKPPYVEYFNFALELSRSGTIIVCDNVVRDGKVIEENCKDEKVFGVQRLNKVLSENSKVTATILQMVGVKEYDGMAIAVVN